MARSARLFLCARCRDQVLLCSHCDRGQVYCSRACSFARRRERRQEAAKRYQSSRSGRLKHAARSARWRKRQRSQDPPDIGGGIDKVTHQGCPHGRADASLNACDTSATACESTASFIETAPEAALTAVTTFGDSAYSSAASVCRRCSHALLPHVRLGWLRRSSLRERNRHDHPA